MKKLWFLINSVLIKTHFIKIKKTIRIDKADIRSIVLSEKDLYGKKRFI